ncbi:MAG: hypothetical protein JWN14_5201, partial [Chthonomonadales bacterium]|nr:hypothetical protein [Chthonomonadales bacterium]
MIFVSFKVLIYMTIYEKTGFCQQRCHPDARTRRTYV